MAIAHRSNGLPFRSPSIGRVRDPRNQLFRLKDSRTVLDGVGAFLEGRSAAGVIVPPDRIGSMTVSLPFANGLSRGVASIHLPWSSVRLTLRAWTSVQLRYPGINELRAGGKGEKSLTMYIFGARSAERFAIAIVVIALPMREWSAEFAPLYHHSELSKLPTYTTYNTMRS